MTEEEMLTLIGAGGTAADAGFRALYDAAAKSMLRFFVSQGTPRADAEDILQNTFIKILRGARSFSGHGTARAWIWQIARNCLTDFLRTKHAPSNWEGLFGDEDSSAPEMASIAGNPVGAYTSIDECVSGGLEAFAAAHSARAYVLHLQMDGSSIEEIASQIGRSAAATKQYLSQCRKKLQPYIAHCTELLLAQ